MSHRMLARLMTNVRASLKHVYGDSIQILASGDPAQLAMTCR
jgi:hypothetical protein